MAKASSMRPGSGGVNANAKSTVAQRQTYGKGKPPKHYPDKKPGMSGDSTKPRRALAGKKGRSR